MVGLVKYEVPEGETINGVCGPGTVMLTPWQYKRHCAPKVPPEYEPCDRPTVLDKLCEISENTDPTIDPPPGGTDPMPEYIKTECRFISGPFCGQCVYTTAEGGFYAFNSQFGIFTEITDVSTVGKNPTNNNKLIRPFTCECPAPDADVMKKLPGWVLEQLAGACFDGTVIPADDPDTVYLHELEITLTHQGDEAQDGFVATSCQAMVTDCQTGKLAKDLEPGGGYQAVLPRGNDVPAVQVDIMQGSNIVVCGSVSVCVDKAGEPLAKPDPLVKRVEGDNIVLSGPSGLEAGDQVDIVDDTGAVVETLEVAANDGGGTITMTTTPTAAVQVKMAVKKQVAAEGKAAE